MALLTARPISRQLSRRLQCKSTPLWYPSQLTMFASTVTKSVVATTTTTLTVTPLAKRDAVPVEEFNIVARQATATPSAIPSYASACSGAAGYSSACSCVGATHTTTTVAAPTTTTTVSSTTTITECADPEPTFFLKLARSGLVLNGVKLDGTYANIDNGDGYLIGFNGDSKSKAAYFSLNAQNNLVMDQEEFNNDPNEKLIAYTDAGQSFELLHFDTPYAVYTTDVPATCSIAGGGLKCSNSGGSSNLMQLCPGAAVTDDLFLGNVVENGCVVPTLEVVPVCVVP